MRRQATPEQKQQAEERRARFRELARQVGQLSEDERTAIMLRAGGIRTIEGHPLTPLNSCLILTQCPGASIVGGFQQWKAAGRSVRKGEKGLCLWVPVGRRKENGERGEVGEGEKPGFIMGTVFDVSQADTHPRTPHHDPHLPHWPALPALRALPQRARATLVTGGLRCRPRRPRAENLRHADRQDEVYS